MITSYGPYRAHSWVPSGHPTSSLLLLPDMPTQLFMKDSRTFTTRRPMLFTLPFSSQRRPVILSLFWDPGPYTKVQEDSLPYKDSRNVHPVLNSKNPIRKGMGLRRKGWQTTVIPTVFCRDSNGNKNKETVNGKKEKTYPRTSFCKDLGTLNLTKILYRSTYS